MRLLRLPRVKTETEQTDHKANTLPLYHRAPRKWKSKNKNKMQLFLHDAVESVTAIHYAIRDQASLVIQRHSDATRNPNRCTFTADKPHYLISLHSQ
jgi:hypothetical protein